jgi:hypothetical protein
MELVIDRSKWLRGEGDKSALLRASDGKMCCLGFYCLAVGLTENQIRNKGFPQYLYDNPLEKTEGKWLVDGGMDVIFLTDYNDSGALPEKVREEKLTEIFATHGVTVKFV